jgi:hypothetical protein
VSIATIAAIALYFALTWGFSGVHALISPSFGLDDVWGAQLVFGINRFLGLGPTGVIRLAAFIAAVKIVAAAFCALHVADRVRGRRRSELLEGALIAVLSISALGCIVAVVTHGNALLRDYSLPLALAAVAFALCSVERALDPESEEPADAAPAFATETAFSPFV